MHCNYKLSIRISRICKFKNLLKRNADGTIIDANSFNTVVVIVVDVGVVRVVLVLVLVAVGNNFRNVATVINGIVAVAVAIDVVALAIAVVAVAVVVVGIVNG
jgi:hypothetical protein